MPTQAMLSTPTSPRNTAFTLVECLVIIGVIAALIGLLFPAIGAVRGRARETACASNLRQIATAAGGWGAEHRGFLPLAGRVTAPAGFQSLPEVLGDAGLQKYCYVHGTPGFPVDVMPAFFEWSCLRSWARAPLDDRNSYTVAEEFLARGKLLAIFTCPDDRQLGMQHSTQSIVTVAGDTVYIRLQQVSSSYAPNGMLLGSHFQPAFSGRFLRGRLASVRSPSTRLLISDAETAAGAGPLFWDSEESSVSAITLADINLLPRTLWRLTGLAPGRHRGKTNVAYVDGHVETIPNSSDRLREVVICGP